MTDGRATGVDLATVETVVDGVVAGLVVVGAVAGAVGDLAETVAGAEVTVLPAAVASLVRSKVDCVGLKARELGDRALSSSSKG